MTNSDFGQAIARAGGECWCRTISSRGERWRTAGVLAVAGLLSVFVGGEAAKALRGGLEASLLVLVVSALYFALFAAFVFGFIRSLIRESSLEQLLQRARALEALAQQGTRGEEWARGFISAAHHADAPVIVRELEKPHKEGRADHAVKLTAQPFVVDCDDESLLVDSPYIELVGLAPSVDGEAAVRDELAVHVGERVVVVLGATDDVQAPSWFRGDALSPGYRERKIRRLVGTEKHPIQLWVVPTSD